MKAYKTYFSNAIFEHYAGHAPDLIRDIESTFARMDEEVRFARTSSNPIDRRLEFSAYFLSTIKVLDQRGESFEKIRGLLIEVALDYVKPRNKFEKLLKKIPAKLVGSWVGTILMRYMDKKFSVRSDPRGFRAQIITDKSQTYGFGYGFDIHECGICKQFERHGLRNYASILCEVDHITSGLAGLKLIRSGTIANGAKICDFRFVRNK